VKCRKVGGINEAGISNARLQKSAVVGFVDEIMWNQLKAHTQI
jgi:hypothetical protein